MVIYTIGYTKKSLEDFIGLLRGAGVDCVIDIRLNNTSQLAGFSKKNDLAFLLKEGFAIDYIHIPDLAPSEEILTDYKSSKDWALYQDRYIELAKEREMVDILRDAIQSGGWKSPCLLCAEPEPDRCHRRLLAEKFCDSIQCSEVVHLGI